MNPVPPPVMPDALLPWWVDLIIWGPMILFIVYMVWMSRRAYAAGGLLSKQSAYLDHQTATNDQALAQQKSMEDLIAKQYAENNRRADEALALSAEAVRLHNAAVEELRVMNAMLAQVAGRGAAG
jgi:hypothetical protein